MVSELSVIGAVVLNGAKVHEAERGPNHGLPGVTEDWNCVPNAVCIARLARAGRRVNQRTLIFDAAVVLKDTCAIAGA